MTLKNNKSFAIAVGAFIFATQASSASASTIWDNGSSLNNSGRCNSNGVSLCGDSGFTIYDDFNITSATKISGFTYDFATGFGGVYTSTRWSIWNSNPSINFSAGPIFAGTITGTVESLSSSNAFRATATGLSASLGAGTYWLGIQTNLTTGLSSYLTSNTNRLGQAIQIGNSGTVYSTALNDMSFSVSGTPTVAAIPEPATWAMMLVGFGMVAGMSRYRRRTAKVTFA